MSFYDEIGGRETITLIVKTFYEGVVRNFAGSDAAREATRKLGR